MAMERRMRCLLLILLALILHPGLCIAQDLPLPTSPVVKQAPTPVDPILDRINAVGHWVFEILIFVAGWFGYSSVRAQSVRNNQNITEGRIEAKQDVIDQTHVIKNETLLQTNQLLTVKLAEPKVAIPVPGR